MDYGTSTSKLVFRDPLAPRGEKAYAIIRNRTFRIPSSVALQGSKLVFGCSPEAGSDLQPDFWYHSIKMRVAGEAKNDMRRFCYGPLPALPDGLTSKDLAILSVWFLLSEAERAICQYLRLSSPEVAITFTLGIPMSFYEDSCLRENFLEIARVARRAYDKQGALAETHLEVKDARQVLQRFAIRPNEGEIPASELRNWIRPESEAAMCLAVKSPGVKEGAYAEVDIGAGTTHASIFSILPGFHEKRWVKEKLAFFSARSEPVGMDALDAKLAELQGIPHEKCLLLRGDERRALASVSAGSIGEILGKIREAYEFAWRRAAPKLHRPELEDFKEHQIFVVGGGSLVPELAGILKRHPEGYPHELNLRRLGIPADFHRIDGRTIHPDEISFLVVAYGLTYDALEVPEAFTPSEFGRVQRPKRDFVHYEDM